MQVVGGIQLLDCESENKAQVDPCVTTHGAQTSGLYTHT